MGSLHDEQVIAWLKSGENAAALSANFGEPEYRELRQLALAAARRRVRGGPLVLILPGIMGSKIGTQGRMRDDVLWLDPLEVIAGKLTELALPQGRKLRPVGVMLFGYLKLKLSLQLAGFNASFHPFDWRLGLDASARELGERIAGERANSVRLVAHSMGGLVARAALNGPHGKQIAQLVQLGTPNYGSFAPVQALRATYPTVRKIAAIDQHHTAEQLAARVFRTLPGLYQMLPAPERHPSLDFFDPRSWPRDELAPDAGLLEEARRVRDGLAPADERCCLIVGVNQETVVGARRAKDSFEYTLSRDGDGTVPRALAEWPNARTWYAEETHGGLTNSTLVGTAVVDLLNKNETKHLPSTMPRKRGGVVGKVKDSALRQRVARKVRWTDLSMESRRRFLEPVISPEFLGQMPGNVVTVNLPQPRLIDSQQRRRTLEIRLACGSITEVQSEAIVLGVFRGVEPGGAAAAIDKRLDGAIKEFTLRRMFSGNRGEVFVLPASRSRLGAELVLLAGLGDFDRFDAEAQQFVTENVVRTFARTHVDEFATVLLGGGSGVNVEAALASQLAGYFRGLKESDSDRRLRRITLVEFDRTKCAAIRQALLKLSATPLFDDIEVSFDEVDLPTMASPEPSVNSAARARKQQRFAYLIVSQDTSQPKVLALRASVLTSGSKAAVLTGTKQIPKRQLDEHLRRIADSGFTARRLSGYGEVLGAMLLHRDVLQALDTVKGHHLVVVHDNAAAAYPWETLCVKGRFPAADAGLSRRYAAENLSVARWREARRQDTTLDVLLVVNPTGDLDGAAAEGDRLQSLLGKRQDIRIVRIDGSDATRERLLEEFRSGRYDVLHYAGHAFFDAEQPGRSGIICADQKVLSGPDLANVSELPALAFFNACEVGRLRAGQRFGGKADERLRRNASLAEAFLRGGVANYVGTYWPVGDDEAGTFAASFYRALVRGDSVGSALNASRGAVRKLGSVDWADYIHYGSYDFTLKRVPGTTR
jgi:pimeloyl-ACP methyl ester carboxylesterase